MAEQQLTRHRNRATGSIVRVDDATAKTLGADYEKVTDSQAKKPRESGQTSR